MTRDTFGQCHNVTQRHKVREEVRKKGRLTFFTIFYDNLCTFGLFLPLLCGFKKFRSLMGGVCVCVSKVVQKCPVLFE